MIKSNRCFGMFLTVLSLCFVIYSAESKASVEGQGACELSDCVSENECSPIKVTEKSARKCRLAAIKQAEDSVKAACRGKYKGKGAKITELNIPSVTCHEDKGLTEEGIKTFRLTCEATAIAACY